MARIKEAKLIKLGNSKVITVPPEYLKIQSKHCQKSNTVIVAFLMAEEISEYENKCQILMK